MQRETKHSVDIEIANVVHIPRPFTEDNHGLQNRKETRLTIKDPSFNSTGYRKYWIS